MVAYGALWFFVAATFSLQFRASRYFLNFSPRTLIRRNFSFPATTMFPWRNIAKSAEATFSRWALKRVCKFFLKKKLGQFILGEIDLDQLDVQLSQGTIQLTDLALNVDFINAKVIPFFLIFFCYSILASVRKFIGGGVRGVNING